jgi:hypothetical protein
MADTSTHQQLDHMITGYWISQAIYAAAHFSIADHLKNGPKTVGELADATSTNPDALYRLLRALASVGIFTEGESRLFSLTPLAEPLRSDIAGSKRALALSVIRLTEHFIVGEVAVKLIKRPVLYWNSWGDILLAHIPARYIIGL